LEFIMFAIVILIVAAAALTLTPALDQSHIVTVAMAIVGVQARPVIRVSDLYRYTGLKRSQIEELIKRQILKPFVPTPDSRVRVVFEEDVARLQDDMVERAKVEAAAKATAEPAELAPHRKRRLARETADEQSRRV
jgi:hypothetical protein